MGQGKSKETEAPIDLAAIAVGNEHVLFREEKFDNDGQERNIAIWSPAAWRQRPLSGIVFVSHGLNEHTLCYNNLAAELVEKHHFVVCGMDHMSHGLSAGRRGVVADHTRLYRDFVRFVVAYKLKLSKEFSIENNTVTEPAAEQAGAAKSAEPDANDANSSVPLLPSFVFAHSMGTLIAMRALMEPELQYPQVQACVLSGVPLFAGPAAASPFGCGCLFPLTRTPVAPCLLSCTSVLDPAGMTAPVVVSEICGNDAYTQHLHLDPRRNPAIVTNKTGYELLHLIEDIKNSIHSKFETPFFAIHGELDSIALKAGSEFVFKNAKTDLLYRKLHVAQGLKHEVIHEADPAGSKCRAMICEFLVEESKRTVVAGVSGVVVEVNP